MGYHTYVNIFSPFLFNQMDLNENIGMMRLKEYLLPNPELQEAYSMVR